MCLASIEPCLPSPAHRSPSGSNWIHEIKHEGYWLMPRVTPWASGCLPAAGNDGSVSILSLKA